MNLKFFKNKQKTRNDEKSIKQLLGVMLKAQLVELAEKHEIENPNALYKKKLIELLKEKVKLHELKPNWWQKLATNQKFQVIGILASIIGLAYTIAPAAASYFHQPVPVVSNSDLARMLEIDFQVLKDYTRTVQYRKDYIKVVDSRMPPNTQVFLKIGYSSRPMDIMQLDSFCNRLILNFYQDCHVDTVYGARIEVVRSRLELGDIN